MTPQLNPVQLQHAIDNGAKLVEAKKLEIQAYTTLQGLGPGAVAMVLNSASLDRRDQLSIAEAIADMIRSKIMRAEVELEELEMQVKAYQFMQKQANSKIVQPNFRG